MKKEIFKIHNIPTIILGEKADQVYIFVHGKSGKKEDAVGLAEIVCLKGYQVLSIDLPGYGERTSEIDSFVPWKVVPELQLIMKYATENWNSVSLMACSIGAYFSMLSYAEYDLKQALFISPILDMVKLIQNMMLWTNVTEEDLETKKIIPTPFGETLYWNYYQYAKANQITNWSPFTSILYAGKDNLTERETVDYFVNEFHCSLTVMEEGEHWFHTPKQLTVLNKWMKENA